MTRALVAAAALVLSPGAASTAHAQARDQTPTAITLVDQPLFAARRGARHLVVELKRAHRVLSTSTVFGGQSERVTHLVNVQSMEARGNRRQFARRRALGSRAHHRRVANELGLPPATTALMGTAASMSHAAHVVRRSGALRVDVFATAGVDGNAVRAGDPARYRQTQRGSKLVPEHGTINLMVLVNHPLLPGAQVKLATVATEAKSAALHQLVVASKKTPHAATGTGTDQLVVAAPLKGGLVLESGSQHLKVGELVGAGVHAAVLEALQLQNGYGAERTRSALHALGRFGLTEALVRQAMRGLPKPLVEDAVANVPALLREARVVAAAYAYAAVLDRLQYGTLPAGLAHEVLRDQAASAAVAVSQRPEHWARTWAALEVDPESPLSAFVHALAVGLRDKWPLDKAGQ